jgi:hypothetical protein
LPARSALSAPTQTGDELVESGRIAEAHDEMTVLDCAFTVVVEAFGEDAASLPGGPPAIRDEPDPPPKQKTTLRVRIIVALRRWDVSSRAMSRS